MQRMQGSQLVRVATEPSVMVSSPATTENYNEKELAAWKSIQQERWEGELNVEGEIPLWLVYKNPSSLHIIHYNSSIERI